MNGRPYYLHGLSKLEVESDDAYALDPVGQYFALVIFRGVSIGTNGHVSVLIRNANCRRSKGKTPIYRYRLERGEKTITTTMIIMSGINESDRNKHLRLCTVQVVQSEWVDEINVRFCCDIFIDRTIRQHKQRQRTCRLRGGVPVTAENRARRFSHRDGRETAETRFSTRVIDGQQHFLGRR